MESVLAHTSPLVLLPLAAPLLLFCGVLLWNATHRAKKDPR